MAKKIFNMVYEPDQSGFVRKDIVAKSATKAKHKMRDFLLNELKIEPILDFIRIESTRFYPKDTAK
ncbi:MAG: hypothetical protein K0U41_07405 [Gammaproteobacteria bacterium]|nr:hypothetical protein [Gammaproteobacteria bacterium]